MSVQKKALAKWIELNLEKKVGFSLEGVETDISKRWEEGQEHHPESVKLMTALAAIDFAFGDDYFCWKTGGDGDNGEAMMYLMDIYFDGLDNDSQKENNGPGGALGC